MGGNESPETCTTCKQLHKALAQLLDHLAEHPSNWFGGNYLNIIETCNELTTND